MTGIAVHVCRDRDEMGDPFEPEPATCGTCHRSWCFACYPTPASLCPWCNGDGPGVDHARAAVPPRQVGRLARIDRERRMGTRPPLDPWRRR